MTGSLRMSVGIARALHIENAHPILLSAGRSLTTRRAGFPDTCSAKELLTLSVTDLFLQLSSDIRKAWFIR